MTRYTKGTDGIYYIKNHKYQLLIGSRAQVWHGTAYKTIGGLTKGDLLKSHDRIVSKSKHISAKKENRLVKAGYGTKKGKFGAVLLNKSKSKSKKQGGGVYGNNFSPASAAWTGSGIDGQGITDFGRGSNDVQFAAGQAGGRKLIAGDGTYPIIKPLIAGGGHTLSPASVNGSGIDGQGLTDYGRGSNDVQFEAGQSGGRRRRKTSKRR